MNNGILLSAPVEPRELASTLNACPSDPPTLNSQPSTLNSSSPPSFPRSPGETPRAFAAFMAYFQLGCARSLPAVAGHLGEKPDTIKSWSSKYHWADRIQSYNSGLLEQQVQAETAVRRQQAAEWSRRSGEFREQEWIAAQKLLAAVQCFLESFGDREVEKMTLAQVSRALQISSRIARQALTAATASEEPASTPLPLEFTAALERAYGKPRAASTDEGQPLQAPSPAVPPSLPTTVE